MRLIPFWIRKWADRRRLRKRVRSLQDELERRQLEALNRALRGAEQSEGGSIQATHRLIDGPINEDTPYFAAMKGTQVWVRDPGAPFVCGLIIESGLLFDGWKPERLEEI